MRQSIGIDMDEVLADTFGAILDEFNRRTQLGVTVEHIIGKKIYDIMPEHAAEIRDILASDGFFRRLKVIEDAQEVVRKLSNHYDIYIVTAAMDVPSSFHDKYEWLKEHFPFLDSQQFVFCGRKNIVATDYLIDDNPKQLGIHTGKPLMFSAPHNRDNTDFERLNNWKEVEAYFLGA
ncbi:5'(3')-deoxyribonucleotidase [Staphylococcus agnetis]|uniref:Putative 5'(3')-deoxyribonucleotidase n=1 Tax=Staphylococcus agnetis TaxID=985762 RepID=A0ABD7TVA1_9STAP|nr:5'(3')-deoxyribonucleotidase [Staphylococcus agnetis]UXU54600.1 5'(3')-deoxyribonucleotidase [Staphylococcus agnetis]UXU56892.1 5'(3')-deoxyribonucleotidase [Staphylococcus agnetis]